MEVPENEGSVLASTLAREKRRDERNRKEFIEGVLTAAANDSHPGEGMSELTFGSDPCPVTTPRPNQMSKECQCDIMKNVPQLQAKTVRLQRELARERKQVSLLKMKVKRLSSNSYFQSRMKATLSLTDSPAQARRVKVPTRIFSG